MAAARTDTTAFWLRNHFVSACGYGKQAHNHFEVLRYVTPYECQHAFTIR